MSRQIKIGNLTLGGGAPVRVQSMTNTDTMDTRATVEQTLRMVEAGCELVRITAPDVKAAENLGRIKEELLRRGLPHRLRRPGHQRDEAIDIRKQTESRDHRNKTNNLCPPKSIQEKKAPEEPRLRPPSPRTINPAAAR